MDNSLIRKLESYSIYDLRAREILAMYNSSVNKDIRYLEATMKNGKENLYRYWKEVILNET